MADPNHVIWHDRRVVFAIPAKNAGTTIKVAIMRMMGLDIPSSPENVIHNERRSPLEHVALDAVPDGYATVGVIRNPWKRLWSSWVYLRRPDKHPSHTLQSFVETVTTTPIAELDQHVRPQWCDLPESADAWLVVGSTLHSAWASVSQRFGWPQVALTHENVVASHRYPYDADAMKAVETDARPFVERDMALYTRVLCEMGET